MLTADRTRVPKVRWAVGSMGPSVNVGQWTATLSDAGPCDLNRSFEIESFLESWSVEVEAWKGVTYIDNQTHERILTKNLKKYAHIWKALADR